MAGSAAPQHPLQSTPSPGQRKDAPSSAATRLDGATSGDSPAAPGVESGNAAGSGGGAELHPLRSAVTRAKNDILEAQVDVEGRGEHVRGENTGDIPVDHELMAHPPDLHPSPSPSNTSHTSHHTETADTTPLPTPTPFPATQRVLSTDPSKPYSAFSQGTKYLIVGISGIAGVFSPISSNIFVPAIPTLADAFHRSEQDISLAVTVYLIFQAITPSFFGSMSDSFGRRPVYIGTLVVYLGANIGLAVMPTSHYWLLLFLRALQSTGGSAVISIGSGCVADIAEPRERGKYVSFFLLGSMLGPGIGPLIGGILAATLGWRSIFWFLVISTGVVLVPLIFFMPETLRSLVGDGSIPPPPLSMSPGMYWHQRQAEKGRKSRGEELEHVERPPAKRYRPWSAFLILLVPEVVIGFIAISFLYVEFYCILTLYSTALRDKYGLSDLKIGLAYLSNGFGIMVSVLTNGRYIDWLFRREEKRVGGDFKKMGNEFRIERTRYSSMIPYTTIFLIACVAQGWCLQVKAPLAATIAMGFFVGLGSSVINVAQLYGQDILPGQGGAVSASLNLVRCLFAAVGTAVINLLYDAIGAGWTMVLLTGLCLAAMPLFWVIAHYGPKWRDDRKAKKERRDEARAAGLVPKRGAEGATEAAPVR